MLVSWDRFLVCIFRNMIAILFLLHRTLVFKLAPCETAAHWETHECRGQWSIYHCDVIIWHQRGKLFVSQKLPQPGTSHLFITGCAPRASSEYKEALFTSIMWDVITYPWHTRVQHAYAITYPQYFWDVITYNIYACRWKYTTSSTSFWSFDSRLLMKIFLCDSLLFECGTIQYWNFRSQVRELIISKSISYYSILWDVITCPCNGIIRTLSGPVLLIWINFNPGMDGWSYPVAWLKFRFKHTGHSRQYPCDPRT